MENARWMVAMLALGAVAVGCGDDDSNGGSDAGAAVDASSMMGDTGVADSGVANDGSVAFDAPTATDGGGGGCSTAFAPESVVGLSIRFDEVVGGVSNTWTFDDSTMASLTGSGQFGYTYVRNSGCASTITFTVGGSDVYQMTWTSTGGGTCTESFNGGDPVACTFVVRM